MSLAILSPHAFATLRDSHANIIELLEYIKTSTDLNIKAKKHIQQTNTFIERYDATFNHDAMLGLANINNLMSGASTGSTTSPTSSVTASDASSEASSDASSDSESTMIFKPGIVAEADALMMDINGKTAFMTELAKELSKLIDEKKKFKRVGALEPVRMEHNSKGHYLVTTKRRGALLEKAFDAHPTVEVHDLTINVSNLVFNQQRTNDVIITLPMMETKSHEIMSLTSQVQDVIKAKYASVCKEMFDEFHECFDKIVSLVSKIDFYASCAKCAHKYRYCKPTIVDTVGNGGSTKHTDAYFAAKQLRHPIVERINTNTQYVAHDVGIGNDAENGVLLYGLNSAGKSTIMKAIGLSVIMAQAGMYVPAMEFTIAPFESLMTRITGSDDIFRGMSSFDLEMIELKAILKRSGHSTMVIGDELCRGTESESGLVIVASMLEMLTESQSKFIFATHMHVLSDLDEVKNNTNIALKHLTVDYCSKTNVMKFDRTLKATSGPRKYGVTVARHIINDAKFATMIDKYETVMMANTMDNTMANVDKTQLVVTKTSNYNKGVYMTECELCGYQPKEGMIPLETHHIEPQRLTDSDGFLLTKPHIHKNTKSNLVVLCHKCHDCIDNNTVIIQGFTETSHGNYLNVDVGKTNIKMKNKWLDLQSTEPVSEKPQWWVPVPFCQAHSSGVASNLQSTVVIWK